MKLRSSLIEAGSNRSWNAKEDTTICIQLVLHPASIALRNSIESHVNTAEAGYLMKIIITQFNRHWHHCVCSYIQLQLNSLMILSSKTYRQEDITDDFYYNAIAGTGSGCVCGGPVMTRSP